ncbi:MAG: ATP phosphoribosyltransferase regulatory subunit [Rhizomicrobium sp.]
MTFDVGMHRGLEYYTGFVFEIYASGNPGIGHLCGGGRYDNLLQALGAHEPIPAVGCAIGVDRLLLAGETASAASAAPDAIVVAAGAVDRRECVRVSVALRDAGWSVETELSGRRPKNVVREAVKRGVPHVVFVGEAEIAKGVVLIKRLDEREERPVAVARARRLCRERGEAPMSGPLVMALPSKGRLHDQAIDFLNDCGFGVRKSGDGREYVAKLSGIEGVSIIYFRPDEIPARIDLGDAHIGPDRRGPLPRIWRGPACLASSDAQSRLRRGAARGRRAAILDRCLDAERPGRSGDAVPPEARPQPARRDQIRAAHPRLLRRERHCGIHAGGIGRRHGRHARRRRRRSHRRSHLDRRDDDAEPSEGDRGRHGHAARIAA